MIKAAFFDVDGTLYSHRTNRVPPGTCRAIAALQARGILCVIATGRHPIELAALQMDGIRFDAYMLLNGQMMLDGQNNILFSIPISGKAKDILVTQIQNHVYPAMIMEANDIYLNYSNDYVLQAQSYFSLPAPRIGIYQGNEILQICPYLRVEEEHLLAEVAEDCVMTRWNASGMDVVAKGGGKMAGIRRYLDTIGIDPREIIAFGDGENDIEMLRFAGIGVAMGNAGETVKAAADYVTADIDDDGIAKALEHFRLI